MGKRGYTDQRFRSRLPDAGWPHIQRQQARAASMGAAIRGERIKRTVMGDLGMNIYQMQIKPPPAKADALRQRVQDAIKALGTKYLLHPVNHIKRKAA